MLYLETPRALDKPEKDAPVFQLDFSKLEGVKPPTNADSLAQSVTMP
jgi:hypothetical protein